MANLIEYLKKFNRKERYWLLRKALGDEGNNPFTLSDKFRKKLECKLNVSIPKAEKVFVAMDYHFDWLGMALFLGKCDEIPKSPILIPKILKDINKNQEDIDLLVAFEDDGKTHVILIEAKAYSKWTNKQLTSKANRLKIFNDADCEPHFVLTSPTEPERLKVVWPNWMKKEGKMQDREKPHWLQLPLQDGLLRVKRNNKSTNEDYSHLRIIDA